VARRTDDWTDDDEALAAELSAHLRQQPGTEAEMPDAEELLAYQDGSLTPADEARVAQRLVDDPEAARALLDVTELDAAARRPVPAVPDLEARSAWRELRGRLDGAGGEAPPGEAPEAGPRQAGPWWRRPAPWAAAAAALLLVSTGLGAWVAELRGARREPVVNLVSLELSAAVRGGGEPTVELAAGQPLLLVVEPAERCAGYEAAVRGPGGRTRTVFGLRRDAGGRLSLLLPGEPGAYELGLYGCEPRRLLGRHRFRVVGAGGG
jgi:hypothetical protein